MANITYSVESTSLTLNGRVFNDLIVGDEIEIAPVNPATSRVNSSNGVSVSKRSDADEHNLTIRVQKNSPDDAYLNSVRNQDVPELLNGSLKSNFNSDGTDGVNNYSLEAGSITTQPTEVINNQDGNAAMEYMISFRFARRVI